MRSNVLGEGDQSKGSNPQRLQNDYCDMSLVLTELSEAGVAMAADSAISYIANGQIKRQVMWVKLLKVPRISAGVSYWGNIGRVTADRFDEWLESKISKGDYRDLRTFADWLAAELNIATGQRLIQNNEAVGLHIAGITTWSDGKARPTFYHVHNGHLKAEVSISSSKGKTVMSTGTISYPTGSLNTMQLSQIVLASAEADTHVTYKIIAQPRDLFSVNPDFAQPSRSFSDADSALEKGYLTHNGDFVPFVGVSSALRMATAAVAQFGPRKDGSSANKIGPHVGDLYRQLRHVIDLYRANKMPRIIDGEVSTLGIRMDGSYLDDVEFKKSDALQIPPI